MNETPAIAGYESFERLCATAGSVLFRARSIADGAPVLVKTFEHAVPAREAERLQREYAFMLSLSASRVPKTIAFVPGRRPGLVLEHFEGEPLQAWLAKFHGGWRECVRAALELTEALDELHQVDVVYGDLRPANLLIAPGSDAVRLVDFSHVAQGTAHGASAAPASPNGPVIDWAYVSPEQTGRMNRPVDYRSDYYSLGVLLYQMLTGCLPFRASDPLQLAHYHTAQLPRPPVELGPSMPLVLSEIVMKLLAKAPEQRYQTPHGLRHDLQQCLSDTEQAGGPRRFELASRDVSKTFLIPRKVYDRERELAALLGAFERVASTGRPRLALVTGHSGVGKSSLVHEMRGPVERKGGSFLIGKFEQFAKQVPYATIAQAFRGLVQRILSGSELEVAAWRVRLTEALGANGAIIAAIIPQIELIIGKQPSVPELPALEAQNRFQLVFRRFIRAVGLIDEPLVLFLDDLHWADEGSLSLLAHVITHPESRHLFVIGAYRDSELGPSHPVRRTLAAIRRGQAEADGGDGDPVLEIALGALDQQSVVRLLLDTLHCERRDAERLAMLLGTKTDNNPLFVKQLLRTLHDEGSFSFDAREGCWHFDLDAIRRAVVGDNVLELMAERLTALPEQTREALRWATCLGYEFALDTLALALGKPLAQITRDLEPALVQDLLVPASRRFHEPATPPAPAYRWVHDRVQQAAYSSIPPDEVPRLHLTIGRRLLGARDVSELGEDVFALAEHFNLAAALLDSEEERIRTIEIDLEAGRKAKASAAHASAVHYLSAGAKLLEPELWEKHPELGFSLQSALAECELLRGRPESAIERALVLLGKARTKLNKAAVLLLIHNAQLTMGNVPGAVDAELECLALFGIELPPHPSWEEALAERERVQRLLGARPIEAVVDLPRLSDAELEGAMLPLSSSILTDKKLHALRTARMVALSLEHGNADISGLWYAVYGTVLANFFGDSAEGERFALAGLELTKRRGALAHESKVYFCLGWVSFWTRPMDQAQRYYAEGFRVGVEIGDLMMACFCAENVVVLALAKGDALDQFYSDSESFLTFARHAGFRAIADLIWVCRQLVRALQGHTVTLSSLTDEHFDQNAFEANLVGDRLPVLVAWYWVVKLRLHFMAGEFVQARAAADKARPHLPACMGRVPYRDFYIYHSLALSADFESAAPHEQEQRLSSLSEYERQLGRMAQVNPGSFRHSHALVRAELARVTKRPYDAAEHYEESIKWASEGRFTPDVALAYELAARFYELRGFNAFAELYAYEARASYERWGALAKVRQLDARRPNQRQAAVPTTRGLSAPERLDLFALLRSSQAISGEIVLDRLLCELMRTVLESAGAQKGQLLLLRNGELVLAAEARVERAAVAVRLPQHELVSAALLPSSILNYVQRTRETLILEDARESNPFSSDEYLSQQAPKSVLCLPVVHQGELAGLLYLENNLVTNAFTPERSAALELLASQAAISLANARLFEERKRAEERFSKAFHDSPTPMAIIRASDGVFVDVNAITLELFGYPRDEVIGRNSLEIGYIDPERRAQIRQIMDEHGSARDLEVCVRNKAGEPRHLLLSFETIDVDGERCFLTTFNDITDRKLAEEQLRQSQKMEAIGRLAGGVAHDFNNLLTAINGYSSLALQQLEPTHPTYGFIREILKSGERASALTQQLLAYSRKQVLEARVWSLNTILAEMDPMLRRLIGEDITMVTALCSEPVLVKVDRAQVEQIILNLVVNARDAMPEGGKLTLETSKAPLETSKAPLETNEAGAQLEAPGPHVLLKVTDTGAGMPPEIAAKVFEPFFTTKELGKGTGLGLSVVYGIVKQSGGSVSISSEPGKGTSFSIFLPDVGATATAAPGAELVEQRSYRGSETILLVEDEESVRTFAAHVLEAQGYKVLAAGDGRRAMEMLQRADGSIQLVVTDVVMPDMGGPALVRQLKEVRPDLAVLYISGYAERAVAHNGILRDNDDFLQKPFSPSELGRKVREVLDRP